MQKYFEEIDTKLKDCYEIANKARAKGYDPKEKVEILVAENMAERVESLISTVAPQIKNSGIVKRIEELESKYGLQDWKVAFAIALEAAQEKFCKFKDKKQAMEMGLRVGLAYLTNGVVASPLEGFTRLELKKTKKGEDYFALYFAGPIRSAGTTANCAFVALSDYVRHKMGYAAYDPTEDEIKRMSTELRDFHERITNLQYFPSEEETEFMTRYLPVQIEGEPTEKQEVSNYKDLERVETNVLSNGRSLIMGEGLTQKAAKFWGKFSQWYKEFDMEHWDFMGKFVSLQKKLKAKMQVKKETEEKILQDYTYISELVAGRPILSYPLRQGGFRLRYGRTRSSGFSADAINPATLIILNNYIGIGSQLKLERPKKANVVATCDTIEGPIIKLNNGSVVHINSVEDAKKYVKDVEEIIYLGDLLVNYGDFLDRAHVLVPAGYCEEWWFEELKKSEPSIEKLIKELNITEEVIKNIFKNPLKTKIYVDEAIVISKKLDIPLHPKYTFHWNAINKKDFEKLLSWLKNAVIKRKDNKITSIIFPLEQDVKAYIEEGDPKRSLELLGIPHRLVTSEYVSIEDEYAKALAVSLGFYSEELKLEKLEKALKTKKEKVLDIINSISEVKIRDKSGTFIGARMGRPEKAKMRKMTGSPHGLFPVGSEGGRLRCFQSTLEAKKITSQFPIYHCKQCNKNTIYPRCEDCDSKTEKRYFCQICKKEDTKECPKHEKFAKPFKLQAIDINHYFERAIKRLNRTQYPNLIKGVRGVSNKNKTPEPLVKGILRATHNIYVNKDGTTRYDMTEMPITAFKSKEINTTVKKLKKLGYKKDIYGEELTSEDQILEIKPQDLILPSCPDSLEEGADEILFRVANFIDDLLINLYKQKKFYSLKSKEDLVGHLVIGLSPHTAAGIVGRIIGFSKTQGLLTHPYYHSFMRRDCDGDEAGVILLMDALLNFSRDYLPNHRGATQDEPIVLSSKLIPVEVDDMIFNMDIVDHYPLELYEAALEYKNPWDVRVNTIKSSMLNTEDPYTGIKFTHDTENINNGTLCSAYKSIPTMMEKVRGQMELAEKIRAVDEGDVARLLIEKHFIRDIKGNLRKFSMQQFRCVACNEKFRRLSLLGKCTKCGGKIIFTVSQGSIVKYLEPALSLAEKYDLPLYVKQSLELTKLRIELFFGKEEEKQTGLTKWF